MSIIHMIRLPMLLAVSLSLGVASGLHAQTSDPTQMSPQIAALLQGISATGSDKSAESTTQETAAPDAPAVLRMRGILLRSDHVGTACLALDEERVIVPLDREKLGKVRFSLGGEQYELIDFSRYGIELRNSSTAESIHVN